MIVYLKQSLKHVSKNGDRFMDNENIGFIDGRIHVWFIHVSHPHSYSNI